MLFTAIIEKPYVMTSYGKIQSLKEDFKKLSFPDAAEAVKLFRFRRDFYEILKYEDQQE